MIWSSKYVGIDTIIAKVYRDMQVDGLVNPMDAVEWVGEAIEMIGAPMQYTEKVARVTIKNYRAKLPCDLHYIITTKGRPGTISDDVCDNTASGYVAMRYSTDAFHHSYCKNNNDVRCTSSLTYKVNDDFIFPNFETGYVLIAYKGIPVDDNGYPKVPDDPKFKEAVASHIKMRIGFLQAAAGKMPTWVYQKLEQDRDWYIGAAQTRGVTPSLDMAESIKNNWIRLIPKINQHADGFASAGDAEQRIIHNATGGSTSSDSSQDNDNTFFNIVVNS